MKRDYIAKKINNKIDEWINTIKDKTLKEELKNHVIVSGGAIASMFLNEDVNDYDVYINDIDMLFKLASYYIKPFKNEVFIEKDCSRVVLKIPSQGIFKPVEKGNYKPVYISDNAITLSNDIQIIVRFHGDAKEIHKNFDFVHATCYWEGAKPRIVTLRSEALESLLTKELIYIGSRYPIASLIRTRKFIKRGFHCSAGQFLKMAWQISELNLKDIKILEEQLVGVDALYFQALIGNLRKEPNKNIDYIYIVKLIDEIF